MAPMQPPSGAGGPSARLMTWTSRVWFARTAEGRQTREPSSLSQMSRAFREGVLSPDVEVAIGGEWVWENVRLVLARYASLAPPNAHEQRDAGRPPEGFPELELTLTGQRDAPGPAEGDATVPAPAPPVQLPPPALPPPTAPPALDDRARRAAPTLPPIVLRHLAEDRDGVSSLDVAIPPRLPSLVFLSCAAVAVLVLLVGGGIGIEACSDRLADAVDARTTLIAVLVGLAWLFGGAVVATAIAVLGRAAAGILLVARAVDENARR
jgi:hypothetical protein